ncbi:sensor histidine kinase ResE [Clostridium pasteurianum DSM 525 = ATCC 6013]|uniref:histidine kinase n=1 Tax=Clostridium pasteurianum DSM 525 = ATCC 6013 TaxID=1262449 RepID=A0A0H3J1E8_CLOPA|nr:ATP-binding protein [Clostridium pasteurianum]AJA47701.1 sensor histidine kinase ResE [Clostridium pasteurianum DSM 525 = ATCC 6013]AJA51689.1 sensor histidine kinase ResE [Clostridium pasteurianum DSM 525 = ATCC 6013]AOZ75004.1 histidine kinase [Clostridium pasteurianum DSM 525 = ATCC 6013]AOZ78799.1 histidine kinase [Clostridium pasteurianum]ELP59604.1 Membrane associatehistidine kinase with HAMP domain [Clostridium pasteurianum DSM 525 = ATCC 6013]
MNFNRGIAVKLFFITLAFFTLFISSILIFQSLFFEKFYISRKMDTLQRNVEKFKKDYNNTSNTNDISQLARDFEDSNNSKVAILDKYGFLNFVAGYDNREAESASVKVIKEVINNWNSNPGLSINILKSGKSSTYIFDNKVYNIKNIVCVVPDSEKQEVVFAVSSLQPVNEASSVIKEFYIYIYISALIFIIILSLIYSNMISKPLISLNKTASKMVNLDFSEKCIVKTNDEIGNLGNTLNFLSESLNNAMDSLKKANEKLKNDIEQERKLEKMRKEFVGGVSHELKTPISLIEGYAEGIKDNIFEEDKNYYIDVIIDEAKKMGALVKDMLDLSQLESGNFKLKYNNFYIDKLISATIRKYYNMLNNREIDVNLNLISSVLTEGDSMRIEQVLTNFITNAIDHTENKSKISIDMCEHEDKVYVYIKNWGKNIEKDELSKIWDKFYKIDKSRNRSIGGTGLGLAITKNILMLHKSDFGVENFKGGVAFYFSLFKADSSD